MKRDTVFCAIAFAGIVLVLVIGYFMITAVVPPPIGKVETSPYMEWLDKDGGLIKSWGKKMPCDCTCKTGAKVICFGGDE